MSTRCPNTDCEHHGLDVCMLTREGKDRMLVEAEVGGLRCLQYEPRINARDLAAPFNCNCTKKAGKYHNVK